MEITEVRIKLMEESDDRLQAFCSITFDNSFVVRDLKIIEGTNGPFVAMPSRKLTSHCPRCGSKNHLRSNFCNHCGMKLRGDETPRDSEGRSRLYADIAHPINSRCREMIQNRVIAEYESEMQRAAEPGYVSRYDDDYTLPDDDNYEADLPAKSGAEGSNGTGRRRAESIEPMGASGESAATNADSDAGARVDDSTARRDETIRRQSDTHIEPAAVEPRPPHRPAAARNESDSAAANSGPAERQSDFGAGIFPDNGE